MCPRWPSILSDATSVVLLLAILAAALDEFSFVASAVDVSPQSINVNAQAAGAQTTNIEIANSGGSPVDVYLRLEIEAHVSRRLNAKGVAGRVEPKHDGVELTSKSRLTSARAASADQRSASAHKAVDQAPAPKSRTLGSAVYPSSAVSASTSNGNGSCNATHRLLLQLKGVGATLGQSGGADGSAPWSRRLQAEREEQRHRRLRASAAFARRLEAAVPGIRVDGWQHLSRVGIDVAELNCSEVADPKDVLDQVTAIFGSELDFAELDKRALFLADGWSWAEVGEVDPRWSEQWGMRKVGVQVAWERLASRLAARRTSPTPTVVAVLDTGVDLYHQDLRERLWANPGEIPGNGIDDDGNGFVDDVHGYDFAHGDGDPSDDTGHGTHCAGIIGATSMDGVGMAGVAGFAAAADVRIMALRFLTADGGFNSDGVLAINYAVEAGAQVLSCSWGGSENSPALRAAMAAATSAGHVVIAAAGNQAQDNDVVPEYPCCFDGVLCVGATTEYDQFATYSNRGANTVDLAAPGSDILSAIHIYPNYEARSGTSYAAPLVAGAVALLWSALGWELLATPADAESLALSSTRSETWLQGLVSTGLLDVESMVNEAEGDSWVRLLSPTNGEGTVLGGGVAALVTVAAGSTAAVPLSVGHDHAGPGTYTANLEITWNGESEIVDVPVRYALVGSVRFDADLDGRVLDWGNVPMRVSVQRTLSVTNLGTGMAQLRLDALPAPFSGSSGEIALGPSETATLYIFCSPQEPGHWSESVLLRTNAEMDPFAGAAESSYLHGKQFQLSLRCICEGVPDLQLDQFSGIVLLDGTNGHVHVEPSIPSEWEKLLVDPDSDRTNVTGPLAATGYTNQLGCDGLEGENIAGRIVLLERGTCYFQTKAQAVQDAGGIGVIIYDNTEYTTLRLMALPDPSMPPFIPAFLVERSVGLSLLARVRVGARITVSLVRKPVVLWTGHPTRSGVEPRAPGSLLLRNTGSSAATWSASVSLLFYSTGEFYTTLQSTEESGGQAFSWTPGSTLHPVSSFVGRDADDVAAAVELPFDFPFFGASRVQRLHISSNGFLAMSPDYVASTLDSYPSLPALNSPNGIIAPYWDDLVCKVDAGCRIKIGHIQTSQSHGAQLRCNGTEAFVVQMEKVQHFDSLAPASIETRILNDGCVEIMYKTFPDASKRDRLVVGVESMNGQHGQNIVDELPFEVGQPFAVSLVPWLVPTRATGGILHPQSQSGFDFEVAGLKSQQGWVTISATDPSGIWNATRTTRIVHRAFEVSWYAGAWGPCRYLSCFETGGGFQSRWVDCVGNDGASYPWGMCESVRGCKDAVTDWQDTNGLTCEQYRSYDYCTPSGGYGSGWSVVYFGEFEDHQRFGHTAKTACCACGGGVEQTKPHPNRTCTPTYGAECGPEPTSTTTTATTTTATTTSTATTTTSTSTTASTTTTSTTTSITTETTTTTTTTGAEYLLAYEDTWCSDGALYDSMMDSLEQGEMDSQFQCEAKCNRNGYCNFMLWGTSPSGVPRCATFHTCMSRSTYEDGDPNVFRKVMCRDVADFVDQKGHPCHQWVGKPCEDANARSGYSEAGQDALLRNCAVSCGLCDGAQAPSATPTALVTPMPTPLATVAPTPSPTRSQTAAPTSAPSLAPTSVMIDGYIRRPDRSGLESGLYHIVDDVQQHEIVEKCQAYCDADSDCGQFSWEKAGRRRCLFWQQVNGRMDFEQNGCCDLYIKETSRVCGDDVSFWDEWGNPCTSWAGSACDEASSWGFTQAGEDAILQNCRKSCRQCGAPMHTSAPTSMPSLFPTSFPTSVPTFAPSMSPTSMPTEARASTESPSSHPSPHPTMTPMSPTMAPSALAATDEPAMMPTPTQAPVNIAWELVRPDTYCSYGLRKNLEDVDSVAGCYMVVMADPECGSQFYTNGITCRCVRSGLECDLLNSSSGNDLYMATQHLPPTRAPPSSVHAEPTLLPTSFPTLPPTRWAMMAPTFAPSFAPTSFAISVAPTTETAAPTTLVTHAPSVTPTRGASPSATDPPTAGATAAPSVDAELPAVAPTPMPPLVPTLAAWILVRRDTYCSMEVRINLESVSTVAECQEAAQTDHRCGSQLYTNGVSCRCVRLGHTCDMLDSKSGNHLYQRRTPPPIQTPTPAQSTGVTASPSVRPPLTPTERPADGIWTPAVPTGMATLSPTPSQEAPSTSEAAASFTSLTTTTQTSTAWNETEETSASRESFTLVQSSIVLVGELQPSTHVGVVLREALAEVLNVSSEQIIIIQTTRTAIAIQASRDTGRRSARGLQEQSNGDFGAVALYVQFGVRIVVETAPDDSWDSMSDEREAVLKRCADIRANPAFLLAEVTAAFKSLGKDGEALLPLLSARVAQSSLRRIEPGWMVGPWTPCVYEDNSGCTLVRRRDVWCADMSVSSSRIEDVFCHTLTHVRASVHCDVVDRIVPSECEGAGSGTTTTKSPSAVSSTEELVGDVEQFTAAPVLHRDQEPSQEQSVNAATFIIVASVGGVVVFGAALAIIFRTKVLKSCGKMLAYCRSVCPRRHKVSTLQPQDDKLLDDNDGAVVDQNAKVRNTSHAWSDDVEANAPSAGMASPAFAPAAEGGSSALLLPNAGLAPPMPAASLPAAFPHSAETDLGPGTIAEGLGPSSSACAPVVSSALPHAMPFPSLPEGAPPSTPFRTLPDAPPLHQIRPPPPQAQLETVSGPRSMIPAQRPLRPPSAKATLAAVKPPDPLVLPELPAAVASAPLSSASFRPRAPPPLSPPFELRSGTSQVLPLSPPHSPLGTRATDKGSKRNPPPRVPPPPSSPTLGLGSSDCRAAPPEAAQKLWVHCATTTAPMDDDAHVRELPGSATELEPPAVPTRSQPHLGAAYFCEQAGDTIQAQQTHMAPSSSLDSDIVACDHVLQGSTASQLASEHLPAARQKPPDCSGQFNPMPAPPPSITASASVSPGSPQSVVASSAPAASAPSMDRQVKKRKSKERSSLKRPSLPVASTCGGASVGDAKVDMTMSASTLPTTPTLSPESSLGRDSPARPMTSSRGILAGPASGAVATPSSVFAPGPAAISASLPQEAENWQAQAPGSPVEQPLTVSPLAVPKRLPALAHGNVSSLKLGALPELGALPLRSAHGGALAEHPGPPRDETPGVSSGGAQRDSALLE